LEKLGEVFILSGQKQEKMKARPLFSGLPSDSFFSPVLPNCFFSQGNIFLQSIFRYSPGDAYR
jgi:hypothetical protein